MNPMSIRESNILAIEDDPVLGAHLHEELQRGGFKVTWCKNGRDALDAARASSFDVVLMDIVMPGLNGFQATRQLSRSKETKHIPVIIVTAKNQQADQVWGERQGAKAYLVKPIDEKQLVSAISAVLN